MELCEGLVAGGQGRAGAASLANPFSSNQTRASQVNCEAVCDIEVVEKRGDPLGVKPALPLVPAHPFAVLGNNLT